MCSEETLFGITRLADIYFTGRIFTLDSAVVKTLIVFSSHEGFIAYAMFSQTEIIKIKLTYCDEKRQASVTDPLIKVSDQGCQGV